jgi:U3 small nucleolar RNA-associated protein 3
VFYFLLKAEGRPVQNHPVIARLVEIRAFLERARPIDKRLRYQMDKLLAAAAAVQVPPLAAAKHARVHHCNPR